MGQFWPQLARFRAMFFLKMRFLIMPIRTKPFRLARGKRFLSRIPLLSNQRSWKSTPGDKVLEIGTGSGYQACILLELGAKVYTIEYNRNLYEKTKDFLPRLGYKPYFFYGDGSKGLPSKAPFDKIIVTAGAPVVPTALTDQLAEGGIMVIPVGGREKQSMLQLRKEKGKLNQKRVCQFCLCTPVG